MESKTERDNAADIVGSFPQSPAPTAAQRTRIESSNTEPVPVKKALPEIPDAGNQVASNVATGK